MWHLVIATQVMNDPLLSASSLFCCQNHSQEYYCMSCLRKCPRSLADSQGHWIGHPFSCSAFICSWSPKLTLGKHGSLQGTAFPRRDFHVWSSIWELKTLPKPKTDQIWRKCWKGSAPESQAWEQKRCCGVEYEPYYTRSDVAFVAFLTVSQAMCLVFLMPISVLRKTLKAIIMPSWETRKPRPQTHSQ